MLHCLHHNLEQQSPNRRTALSRKSLLMQCSTYHRSRLPFQQITLETHIGQPLLLPIAPAGYALGFLGCLAWVTGVIGWKDKWLWCTMVSTVLHREGIFPSLDLAHGPGFGAHWSKPIGRRLPRNSTNFHPIVCWAWTTSWNMVDFEAPSVMDRAMPFLSRMFHPITIHQGMECTGSECGHTERCIENFSLSDGSRERVGNKDC